MGGWMIDIDVYTYCGYIITCVVFAIRFHLPSSMQFVNYLFVAQRCQPQNTETQQKSVKMQNAKEEAMQSIMIEMLLLRYLLLQDD